MNSKSVIALLFVLLSLPVAFTATVQPSQTRVSLGFTEQTSIERTTDCISPEQRSQINRKIAEYERRKSTVSAASQTGPLPYEIYPQAGNLWQDLFIPAYVDLDPGSGILDWDCTQYTYNGHTGNDSAIRTFREQAIGVPIFAPLDGTVVDVHDGEPDMNTYGASGCPPGILANYVILDHGNSHYSYYWHLKRGSVAISLNQFVKTGTQMGLTGASGCANGPHVHFESRFQGAVYEPYMGPCRPGMSNWINQIPLRHEFYVRDFCFSRTTFSGNPLFENNTRVGAFPLGSQIPVYYRTDLSSQPANSTYRVRFRRPDGTIPVDSAGTFNNNPFFVNPIWYWFTPVSFNVTGTWHLLLDINDQTLIDAPFEVVSSESEIVNRPPNPIATSFDPQSPTTNDAIFCRVHTSLISEDPDYDIIQYRYQWSINGVTVRDVTTAALSDAIPKGSVQTGDNLTCTVTPSDGKLSGPTATFHRIIGLSCSYALSSAGQSFASSGGSGSIMVTAPTGCDWIAGSNASWITLTSGNSDNGNGTIHYEVAANTSGDSRIGAISVQDQTFTITQTAVDPLSISSVVFDGKKKMTIEGIKFGSSPHVFINGTDRTDHISSGSDTEIKLKGKAKKLGLKSGDNAVQVTDAIGNASNVFILKF